MGVSFLVVSGLIVKILGLIHKIILVRILTFDGITFYTLATPTILLLFSLSSFGLKESISKIVSENIASKTYSNRSIMKKGLKISLVISISLSLLMVVLGSSLASILNNNNLYYMFLASLPLCIIVSVSHVFKGYFSGLNMLNTLSISQIIEQIVRLISSILLAFFLIKYGIVIASIGVLIGSFLGELSSLLYLIYKASKITSFKLKCLEKKDDMKRLLDTSIPLVISHTIGSLSYFLEPIILTMALSKIGLSSLVINQLFGSVNGYVIPLLTLFGFFSYAISFGITPSITNLKVKKEYKQISKIINSSVFVVLIPSGLLLLICFFYPKELLMLLYNESYGYKMVSFLSFFFVFYYVGIIYNSLLYACSPKLILKISIYSSIVKLFLLYFLCVNESINSYGILLSLVASLLFCFIISLYGNIKYLKYKIDYKMIFGFVMVLSISFCFIYFIRKNLLFYQGILVSSLLYFTLFLLFRRFFKFHKA